MGCGDTLKIRIDLQCLIRSLILFSEMYIQVKQSLGFREEFSFFILKFKVGSWAWWSMPIIYSTKEAGRQED
jgi:hypothetical protein